MKRLSPEELSLLLNADVEEQMPPLKPPKRLPDEAFPRKRGRGP